MEEYIIQDMSTSTTFKVTEDLQGDWVFCRVYIQEEIDGASKYYELFETEAAHIT